MLQVLFQNGKFQWQRAEKLLGLAKEGSGGLDITSTVRDAVKVVLLDDKLRMQLVNAFTEDNKLHIDVSLVACSFLSSRPGWLASAGVHVMWIIWFLAYLTVRDVTSASQCFS